MQRTIPRPVTLPRGDGKITLGLCPLCGRKLSLSRANKIGARCTFEGAQFDTEGKLLWTAATAPRK